MSKSESKEILRKVLVLYVGGTIGMTRNQDGVLSPEVNTFYDKVKCISQLHDNIYAESRINGSEKFLTLPLFKEKYRVIYKIKEFSPLLDSSCMGASDWKKIGSAIQEVYSDYDGFVVAHGTDTLVYTASSLSFMFENLEKPIIITGSQLSIHDPRSDGISNLQHSLIISGVFFIPEVCIFFGKFLLRGNRTVKLSTDSFEGFASPNVEPLACVGSEIILKLPEYQQCLGRKCIFHTSLNTNVSILIIHPHISEKTIKCALEPPTEGIVLLTYGTGNIPLNNIHLIDAIKEATGNGILVVNCSQCLKGSVKSIYETNKVLMDCGAISAYDMTMEATYTKLMHILSMKNLSYNEKVKMLVKNLRGELTNTEV